MSSVENGSNRPHGRLQEDAPNSAPTSSFTASEEVWFEDGNIILVCESIGFRVYKGILSSQSEVFRDMFHVSSPSAAKIFDGCAVVHLSDSVGDTIHFLKALHDRNYGRPSFRDDPEKALPLDTIASILRMATKYTVHGLRKEMVDELKAIFPSTHADFVKSDDDRVLIPNFNGIFAVNIATECRIPIILPAAYYCCSLLSTQTLLEGFRLDSGVVVKLPSQALSIVLAFRRNIVGEITLAMHISSSWKSQQWRCRKGACATDPIIAAFGVEAQYVHCDEEGIFRTFCEGFSKGLCHICYTLLKASEIKLQQTIWELLPDLCEEESWATLGVKQKEIDRDDDDFGEDL